MTQIVRRTIKIPNDTRYLSQVRRTVSEVLALSSYPRRGVNLLVLAVDEAVTNILEHGYADAPPGEYAVEVEVEADEHHFSTVIHDNGRTFDPTKAKTPDIREHVRHGMRDGLGIYLIRRIMDEISYSYQQGVRNELRMTKYVDPRKVGRRDGMGRIAGGKLRDADDGNGSPDE